MDETSLGNIRRRLWAILLSILLTAGTFGVLPVYADTPDQEEPGMVTEETEEVPVYTLAEETGESLSVSEANYPVSVKEGTAFYLKGTISSQYELQKVKIGVVKSDGTTYYPGAYYENTNTGGKTFDIAAKADPQVDFTILPAGTYYYRVYANDVKGNSKRLMNRKFTVLSDYLIVSGANYPTTVKKGSAFYLKGTIKSVYPLKTVKVGIVKSDGTTWLSGAYYENTNEGTRTFDIAAKADPKIDFTKLSAGTYYYRVYGKDSKGNSRRLVNRKFTVTSTTTASTSTAAKTYFSTKGINCPVNLKAGSAFYLKGTITGVNTLKQVEVGIVNSAGTAWVSGFYYNNTNVGSKTFDIAVKADPKMIFPNLPKGTYYYRIWAHDTKGNKQRLVNQKFTVSTSATTSKTLSNITATAGTSTASYFTLSGANYPTTIKKGSAYYLKGKITGTNTLKKVKVGVVKSDGTTWVPGVYYENANVGTKTFDIAGKADPVILFPNLPAGTYYYRVYANDTKGNSKRLMNKKFTVTSGSTGTKVGNYTLTSMTYPTEIMTKGQAYTIKGKITDTRKITRIEAGIVSGTSWVKGHYYNNTSVNAKTFDLAKAAPSMKFDTLPAGTYYYRIWGHDADGAKRLVNRKFTVESMEDFEAYMTKQGFPASYKPYLRKLHNAHPTWKFVAQKTGLSWSDVLAKQNQAGVSLINPEAPDSQKNQGSQFYNKKTKTYTNFDGRWHQASNACIAYYLDPRNYLNEDNIYALMDHHYTTATGTVSTISRLVDRNNCFLNTETAINDLKKAGTAVGVNPNVLVAMIVSEVGWQGSSITSGTVTGYKGYYNYYNIGAWTTSTMTAVQRGLWFAKGSGTGATSYSRPWNTRYKAIKGGAEFYAESYMTNDQYTYYTKRFNVMNGLNAVATHQYGTCIYGPRSEGRIVKLAYTSTQKNLVFYVPVYKNMPSQTCQLPT